MLEFERPDVAALACEDVVVERSTTLSVGLRGFLGRAVGWVPVEAEEGGHEDPPDPDQELPQL